MKCSLCGCVFNEQEAQQACKGCPVMKGCRLIKCPRCGFETPPDPAWARYFRKKEKGNESKD